MLDAVLPKATLDGTSSFARDLCRPDRALRSRIAGETLAAPARSRRADRRRHPPAIARQFEGRVPSSGLRSRRRSVSAPPPMPWLRRRFRWSTAVPAGLVHGVLGTLLRRGLPQSEAPACQRKVEHAGARLGATSCRSRAPPDCAAPPLDLTFADDAEARPMRQRMRHSLAPGHVRVDSASVTELPGLTRDAGGFRTSRIATSASHSARRRRRARPLRGTGRQDDAARGRRPPRYRSRRVEVVSNDLRENLDRTHLDAELVTADARSWEPRAVRRDPARCALFGDRHVPPSSRSLYRARPASSLRAPSCRLACSSALIEWLKPGGSPRLLGLLARAGRRGASSAFIAESARVRYRGAGVRRTP